MDCRPNRYSRWCETTLPSCSLILETEFETRSGKATVVDFMPPADGRGLIRIVVGQTGKVDFSTEFVARFEYGATVPWVTRLSDGGISAVAGPSGLSGAAMSSSAAKISEPSATSR